MCALLATVACGAPDFDNELALGEETAVDEAALATADKTPYTTLTGTLKADTEVGAAVFRKRAYFAYVRSDGTIGIVHESRFKGTTGDQAGTNALGYGLADRTNSGASLIVYGDMLHLAYVGADKLLYMRRSSDGLNWEPRVLLDGYVGWQHRPVFNVWSGGLRVFGAWQEPCTGTGCLSSTGPTLWQIDISGTSAVGAYDLGARLAATPATATHNDQLFLAWMASDGQKTIWMMHYDAATGWSGATAPGAKGRPALQSANGKLHLLYVNSQPNPLSPTTIVSTLTSRDSASGVLFEAEKRFGTWFGTETNVAPFFVGGTATSGTVGTVYSAFRGGTALRTVGW